MSLADHRRTINRLSAIIHPAQGQLYARYLRDPVRYAHEVLGIKALAPDVVRVLEAYARNDRCRILVPSANETGKSHAMAIIMSHHYDCRRPGLTFCTAPSQAQVTDILFRELRKMRRGDPGFSPKAPLLTDGTDHICKGFTATGETSFQGRHDAHVLMVFDEAEDIDPEFWEAAEGFCDQIIAPYNPTKGASQAAFEERSGRWDVIRMSALSHPNVTYELRGMEPPIPNAVNLRKTIARLQKWSTVLTDLDAPAPGDVELCGVRYRPGPVAQARVLGVRPNKPVNAVYSSDVLHSTVTNVLTPQCPVQIGCDVARYGDDFTVFHVRKGCCSLHHEGHNGWNTIQIARRLRDLCVLYGGADPRDVPCVIDDTGNKAGGVIDQAQGFRFIAMNVALPSNEPEEYPNLRSQLYFDFEELCRAGLVDLSRIGPVATHDIIEQLMVASYELDGKARRVVLNKKLMKAALSRSPDDADAVLLSYYQFPETLEHHS